jgi:hypothetical protein
MVDTKLNTGSLKKKHIAEAQKEKTEKIVKKFKQENGDGPPAKKVKNEKVQEAAGGDASAEKKKSKRSKKKALKETAIKVAKRTEERENELQKQAAEYLDTWKNNKESWKFSKNLQTWLIASMFDVDKVLFY